MPINRWADKPNVVHDTVEYYSVLKNKEILMHATLWRKLEAIILSEISHLLRDTYNEIPLVSFLKQSDPQKQKEGW